MKKEKICPECGNYRMIVEQISEDIILEFWDDVKGKIVKRKKSGRVVEHLCRTCFEQDEMGAWMLKKEYR